MSHKKSAGKGFMKTGIT